MNKRKPHIRTRSRQKRPAKSPARKSKSKAINLGVHRAGLDISVTTSADEKSPTLAALIGAKEPKPGETVRVQRRGTWPRDWWQAVKERFAPAWAKLRWPVQYSEQIWWEDVRVELSTSTAEGSVTERTTFTASVPIELGALVSVDGEPIGYALESGTSDDKLQSRPGYVRITPGSGMPPGSKRGVKDRETADVRSWTQKGWDGRNKSTMVDAPAKEDGVVANSEFQRGWQLNFDYGSRPTD